MASFLNASIVHSLMIQVPRSYFESGGRGVGADYTFSVILYNFQKSGGTEAPQAPPPPRALLCWLVVSSSLINLVAKLYMHLHLFVLTPNSINFLAGWYCLILGRTLGFMCDRISAAAWLIALNITRIFYKNQ